LPSASAATDPTTPPPTQTQVARHIIPPAELLRLGKA
jgi:hypothetical protein